MRFADRTKRGTAISGIRDRVTVELGNGGCNGFRSWASFALPSDCRKLGNHSNAGKPPFLWLSLFTLFSPAYLTLTTLRRERLQFHRQHAAQVSLMPHKHNRRFWRTLAQCFYGSFALALLTFVCFGLPISCSIIESHGSPLRPGDNSRRSASFYFALSTEVEAD